MKPKTDRQFIEILELFRRSFQALGTSVPPIQIETLTILVYEVMSARWRNYHSPEHIIEISRGAGPIETLAILFHDLVYLQVDRRIHPKLQPYVREFVLSEDYHQMHVGTASVSEPTLLCFELFGWNPRKTYHLREGLNEFLSAVVACHILSAFLTRWEVIQVLTGIEVTVPFRAAKGTKTALLQLERRLSRIDPHRSDNEIHSAIKQAVRVSTRDVSSFASEDLLHFLSHTWKLILEGNPVFRNPMHTVGHYRLALEKVRAFLETLSADSIFLSHRGEPPRKHLGVLLKRARQNLKFGIEYLHYQIIAAGLLEAVAIETGGDTAMQLWREKRIPAKRASTRSDPVLRALQDTEYSHFDFPLYLRQKIRSSTLNKLISGSSQFSKGKISPLQYLSLFPRHFLLEVIQQLSSTTWTRRQALRQLESRIEEHFPSR